MAAELGLQPKPGDPSATGFLGLPASRSAQRPFCCAPRVPTTPGTAEPHGLEGSGFQEVGAEA